LANRNQCNAIVRHYNYCLVLDRILRHHQRRHSELAGPRQQREHRGHPDCASAQHLEIAASSTGFPRVILSTFAPMHPKISQYRIADTWLLVEASATQHIPDRNGPPHRPGIERWKCRGMERRNRFASARFCLQRQRCGFFACLRSRPCNGPPAQDDRYDSNQIPRIPRMKLFCRQGKEVAAGAIGRHARRRMVNTRRTKRPRIGCPERKVAVPHSPMSQKLRAV
jgi:hypothetical protein